MTIERLHFEDGYPINPKIPIEEQLAKAFMTHRAKIEVLPEGDYDLTPKWWTKHLMNHKLTVLENGNGIYRATPRDSDVGIRELSQQGVGPHKPGGNVIHLPQDRDMAIVAGPLKDLKTIGAYEIIIYAPGPSPKKNSDQTK